MSQLLILVGQPSVDAIEPIRSQLQKHGYELSVMTSAHEVLASLKSAEPKAILVDVAMPEVMGLAICGTLRAEMPRNIPIVALNQGDATLRQAALAHGADIVIDEPIRWTDLHSWLQAPLTSHGQPSAVGALLGQTSDTVIGTASLLSHDLKSPISVIISSLEVLLAFQDEDSISDPTQRLLQGALHAAYRQLNLVSTLVDLPRLELDCYDLQLTELDLARLVNLVLDKENYTLEVKGLKVSVEMPDSPVMVMADRDLLEQVVSALVDCVMKFTVREDELCISLRQEQDQVVLRFTDTGRPIQPGFERDIMTMAPQWQHRQAGARTSVALGLPFVYMVAQVHEGSFTARSSENGKWTTFTFSLPSHL